MINLCLFSIFLVNGKLYLRIEDTDQSRVVPGAIDSLISILKWTGINFDHYSQDGKNFMPFVQQSNRLHLYQK